MAERFDEYNEYFTTFELDKSVHSVLLYKRSVNNFLDHFNISSLKELKKITTKELREYQSFLKKKPKAKHTFAENELDGKNAERENSSVNSEMRPIKAFIKWMYKEKFDNEDGAPRITELKLEKKVKAIFSPEEIGMILNACTREIDLLMFSLMLMSGIREGEIINIKLEDIMGNRIIINGKGGKQRTIAINNSLLELLNSYIAHRNKKYKDVDSDYLFLARGGKKFTGNGVWTNLRSMGLKAGIPEKRMKVLHPHSIRHTFAAKQIGSRVNMKTLQEMLGHSQMATTANIYAQVADPALVEAFLAQDDILKDILHKGS